MQTDTVRNCQFYNEVELQETNLLGKKKNIWDSMFANFNLINNIKVKWVPIKGPLGKKC